MEAREVVLGEILLEKQFAKFEELSGVQLHSSRMCVRNVITTLKGEVVLAGR